MDGWMDGETMGVDAIPGTALDQSERKQTHVVKKNGSDI